MNRRARPTRRVRPTPSGRTALWRAGRRRSLAHVMYVDRVGIFLPAVVSIGVVFWLVGEVRGLMRASRDDARDKRAIFHGRHLAATVRGLRPAAGEEWATTRVARRRAGQRPRVALAVVAAGLAGVAAYLSVGLYWRQQQELRGAPPGVSAEAWLLSLASLVAVVLVTYASAAASVAALGSRAPAWAMGLVHRSMLSVHPVEPDEYPGETAHRVTTALTVSLVAAIVLSVAVAWVPWLVQPFDDGISGWLRRNLDNDALEFLDPLGRTKVMLALAVIAGLSVLWCRVLGTAYLAALMAGLLVSVTVRPVVARPRPPSGGSAGLFDSYPSGHIVLAVLFAGAMPLAIAVILHRRWLVTPLRLVMAAAVAASAVHRVVSGSHWPSDIVGGALVGLALVFAIEWVVQTEPSHRLCHRCLWSHQSSMPLRVGVFSLRPAHARGVRWAAHLAAATAALGLAVLGFTRGLPSNDSGFVFPAAVVGPVQLALAGLVSVAALVAWKWDIAGAVLLALAAVGLGVFAAVQYAPWVAVAMTVALLVPAVLLWAGWQHRRRPWELVAVAVTTALLVGSTWVAANAVYDRYFGPTHPTSSAPTLAVDRVEWVWTGGLTPSSVVVTARLASGGESATAEFTAADGSVVRTEPAPVGEHRIVRLDASGLQPGTEYRYRLLVDGNADEGRGQGKVYTPVDGPLSFRLAVSSCARVGSNGAVFDAIRAADPLLYLATGDLHYGNLTATEPGPFLDAFDRLLTAPGQAALYRDVPVAYVWDDHDYGPNDADATSPGRAAARAAYRSAVPSYAVTPGDAAINQAFTVGRVRVVMTDNRSERTADTMLGEAQLEWLIDELTSASRTHALVLWVNPVPWIGEAQEGADTWAGYPEERRRIADALAAAGVRNLVMVSGDAHMVAIDDGSNSAYATDGSPGFPVLHAAALDRPGNVKGGPYSEGTFPGGGQYGLVDITDTGGDTVSVRLSGWRWDGTLLTELTVEIPVPATAR